MTHVWIDVVTDIRENVVTLGGHKDANDKGVVVTERQGWVVRFGNVGFHYTEKPEFEKGDRVRFTMEKA